MTTELELRGALSEVTAYLEELLEEQRFPGKGRSRDQQQANLGWWEDRQGAVRRAKKLLG